jgi:hypothetical protein
MDERAEGGFAMSKLKITAFAGAALLGSIGAAAAMPSNALPQASKQVGAYVQDVRLVCGPGGCWQSRGTITTGGTTVPGAITTGIDR